MGYALHALEQEESIRRYERLFAVPFDEPCIVILGQSDEYYRFGLAMVKMYNDAMVLEHPGGHHFPKIDSASRWIYEKIAEQMLSVSPALQRHADDFESTPLALDY